MRISHATTTASTFTFRNVHRFCAYTVAVFATRSTIWSTATSRFVGRFKTRESAIVALNLDAGGVAGNFQVKRVDALAFLLSFFVATTGDVARSIAAPRAAKTTLPTNGAGLARFTRNCDDALSVDDFIASAFVAIAVPTDVSPERRTSNGSTEQEEEKACADNMLHLE